MTKEEALNRLDERRKFFLDKGLFGRAEIMSEIKESIKDESENFDFDFIKNVGLHLEPKSYY